ncbi:hypothetical protein LINPERHAP1_LOCUS4213 [Linum perenne]
MHTLLKTSVPFTEKKMMPLFHLTVLIIWVLLFSMSCFASSPTWCPLDYLNQQQEFKQMTDRFWQFHEDSNTWVELKLPFDLLSCVDDNCTKVGSIESDQVVSLKKNNKDDDDEEQGETVLPQRKRISLTKMSETSIWVTGESGSIYERFWNGVQWVVAPHDLPLSAGHAIAVFIVNHTILALSESGVLYQMQLTEIAHPIWVEISFSDGLIKSGVVSHDGVSVCFYSKVYFCTKSGSLVELSDIDPTRWVNHGRPPGGNVAAIADAANVLYTISWSYSSTGDLYEYNRMSKPSWKKHIWNEGAVANASLASTMGYSLHGMAGDGSISLFLLTKDESNDKFFSLFLTTATGSVVEYRMPKHSGELVRTGIDAEAWLNHLHPQQAKAARGIGGIQIQVGRILFPLDDGRLAELHVPGQGGDNIGPNYQASVRRKPSVRYTWSTIDSPETEGWNLEYCREDRGPANCIMGIKDEQNDARATTRSNTRRRKGSQAQQEYLSTSSIAAVNTAEENSVPDSWINSNFRLRVMHGGMSFFLITDGGFTFEYLYNENVWLWLRHDHPTPIRGALGNYNGSLFLVDTHGSLLIRERSGNELAWINCTAMRRGKQVIGGPPWDSIPGKAIRATAEDSIFFVSRNGRLVQFTVALRKFKWKDCRSPPDTKVATIVDQELFRHNIVFVTGKNGRLYQYNKVTELWHEHYQSQHLSLSRLPGTAMRSSSSPSSLHSPSLTGSLFMLSEDGGLVEYHWNSGEGWNWIEHGTPNKGVTFTTSPSPCFEGNLLFLIGTDGKVYMRYMDEMTWKWRNCGFPYIGKWKEHDDETGVVESCIDKDFAAKLEKEEESLHEHNQHCDPKVASTRPIPFSEDSVIFELRDGRLAEMKRAEGSHWVWSRTIGTPTSYCISNYWTAVAS